MNRVRVICERTDHAILSASAQENVMSHFEDFYRSQFGEKLSAAEVKAKAEAEAGDSVAAHCNGSRTRAAQWLVKHARAFRLTGEAR
ncbi:hypothetical protein [Paraburkholderia kirstenboschensis]|uniref:hypothetical protein n=1 Tax=Paraburkholderia kirstenboschensis TaxID=1245436 RepID=UPI001FB5531A|nr:hypothetical protein [Paraburkholderia kirstenboschensis]